MTAAPLYEAASRKAVAAKSRLLWVDVLRGLCICLVVLHHMPGDWPGKAYLALFRIPLFFMISGFLFRTAPVAEFVKRRFNSIIIPYLAFSVLVVALDQLLVPVGLAPAAYASSPLPQTLARIVIGGWGLFGPLGPLWFLPVLFLAASLYNLLYRWAGGSTTGRMLGGVFCISLVQYAISLTVAHGGRIAMLVEKTPHVLFAIPAVLLFIWLGNVLQERRFYESRLLLLVAFAGILISFLAPPMDIKNMKIGAPYLMLPTAVGLSLVVGMISFGIARIPVLNTALVMCGRMSISILCLHGTVIWQFKEHLPFGQTLFLAITLPIVAHFLLNRGALTRRLFLGGRATISKTVA